jgi:hypothetical protein
MIKRILAVVLAVLVSASMMVGTILFFTGGFR